MQLEVLMRDFRVMTLSLLTMPMRAGRDIRERRDLHARS